MGEHTDAFNNQVGNTASSEVIIQFTSNMSAAQFREITQRARARGSVKNSEYVSNREIYDYCKEFNIKPDKLKQDIVEEDPKKHYHLLEVFQDIVVNNRNCFVRNNNTEKKLLTIQYQDDYETEIIDYNI